MPGKRITDLTALSGANSANNDDLVIFDATASETKRISRSQLAEGMQADVQVFSNKTMTLGSNTVTGTTAQFNTALTDNNFATQAGAETLTNKTIDSASNTLTVNYKEARVETSDASRTHLFTTVAALLADTGTYTTYAAGQIVEAGGFRYEVAASGASDQNVTTAGGVKLYVRGDIITQAQAPSADIAAIGYSLGAMMLVKSGETVKLTCDPSSGGDIQAMANWFSSHGHFVETGGNFYIEVADGLHNVSTYIDVVDGGLLDIRGTADPDFLDVASATFSGASGAITATIVVSALTPLPSRVQAGFAVGGLNIQGDGGADLLNCGMIVKARTNNTTFTADLYSNGTNLAAFTTPDNTASLGLTPNKLMVPKCTIRAAEAGWDGAAREGFMNAERGGRIHLRDIGLSYNGVAGDNDMLFATDSGSEISLEDYCVIAGSGEMCVRSFNHANIYTNRSCLGGAHTGANIWQGSGGGTFTAIRTMMGSVTGDALSNSSGAEMFITASVVTGANILARTTYPDSSANITDSRLSRGNLGVAPTEGNILIDSSSSIKNCTTPISVAGSQSGIAHGNPTISDNTNPTVTAFAIQDSGGVWLPSATKPYDAGFYKVGRFSGSLNFPSISANSYADLTVSATGAAFNDFCLVQRSGSAEPAQGIDFRAFVSAADTVTVRAYNITTGAIDPTAFTALVLVIRAT